jgi:D-amino-acid dehydrogenase
MRDVDVLILGAGVIGLACAHELLRAGRSVVVLDRTGVGAGASHGNCGTITPSHAPPLTMPGQLGKALRWMLQSDAPFYVKPTLDPALIGWMLRFARRCNWSDFKTVTRIKAELLQRSREQLAALVRDALLDCEFDELGTLYVFREQAAMDEAMWLPRALAEVGLTPEIWDGTRCRAREPVLNDSIVGGFYNPGDAHLRPDRYVDELARAVREFGGEIIAGETVQRLVGEGDRIASVHTDAREWRAREVVFALGAWSPALLSAIGVKLPQQPGKGYSITFDRPARAPRLPLVLKERSVCVTTWSTGYRLGSTMEFSGYDSTLNRTRLDALVRGAGEYLHEPAGPNRQEEWYGWRPMTYDDLPVIGRTARWRNLVLATGHGMLGVSLSAVTATLVGEVIAGVAPSLDISPFRVERFA